MAARLESPDTSLPYFLGAAQVALSEPGAGSAERQEETAAVLRALFPYVAALIDLGRRHPMELAGLMASKGKRGAP
jgi:hypothetical protein